MSPPDHKKFPLGIAHATRFEEKLSMKEVGRETIMKLETKCLQRMALSPNFLEISDSDLDLESTAKSRPKCNELEDTYMAPSRRSSPSNEENPDIATIIAQQLQTILPQIVTQVTNNVNNANAKGGNGGNGGNNGCSYKTFMACNPKEYDGKGGAIALTRWIEKMESVFDNSGCDENQRVKFAASSFVNKALT
ncbi:hypothetical protein Tco_0659112 [Tanacetum coccineum]